MFFEKRYFLVTLDRHILRTKSKSLKYWSGPTLIVFSPKPGEFQKKITYHFTAQLTCNFQPSHKGAKFYPRKCTFVEGAFPKKVLQLRRLLCVPLKLIFVELGLVTCTSFQHSQSGHQFCQAGVNDPSWNCHSFFCLLK